mgnify:CR=1 FL=1
MSRAEGYAIQAQIEAQSREPLFGWKIAATSLAGQKHIGVDGPMAGRLLAERVYCDGDTLPFGANRMRVAEDRVAFTLIATVVALLVALGVKATLVRRAPTTEST